MLKINLLQNLPVFFVSTGLRSIQLQKYVVLSMWSSYWSCNIHLILKLVFGLIYIRVVPCATLDFNVEK